MRCVVANDYCSGGCVACRHYRNDRGPALRISVAAFVLAVIALGWIVWR